MIPIFGLLGHSLWSAVRIRPVLRARVRLLGAPLLLLMTLSSSEAGARRPNLLFLITDDQRWDALGVVQREHGHRARFPWFQTPHLDRLAAEGTRFRNAFVVHSLCSPSRASFLSGQSGHRNGVVDNSTHFSADAMNQATLLRSAGYKTAYIGKFHMAFQKERPGFDHVASYTSQGEYFGSTFLVNGTPRRPPGWVDDIATDHAIEFLQTNRTDPWLMVLGFKAAHTPRQPPERARTRFAGESVRRAVNAHATPSYGKGQRAFKGEEIGQPVETDSDSEGSDDYLLNYFRCLSAIDDNVGRLLRALAALGLENDTVVVFAGDNGYFLGEHGLGDKRSAFEESMRIPLLLKYPRLKRLRPVIDEMVLNIDLAPTFLDLAGVRIPEQMQGKSWKPLFRKEHRSWRGSFVFDYYFEPNLPATPTMRAVRTPGAKLIVYPGHQEWDVLFDLALDPYELRNVLHEPRYEKLLKTLRRELSRHGNGP